MDRQSADLACPGMAVAPALDRRQGDGSDLQRQRQRPALLGALRRRRYRARSPWPICSNRRNCRTAEREARIDITQAAGRATCSLAIGARLLMLEQCGFLLRKVETYDTSLSGAGRCL